MLAVALTIGILWARNKSRGELCTTVDVEVINADSTSFVTPQGVLNDLSGQGVKLVGKHMGDIDASDVEEALKLSPYLESADIVKCQGGRVLIRVSQLVPVLRVFDGENSYYVNRAGKQMSASSYYHCDVPVVQGHFTRKYPATRLLPLIDYVEGDSLLRSLVTMYQVRDTNNIIVVPSISGHVVNIGNADGFENKFAKLKLFYKQVMPQKGWNTFDTISVKWNHQIVATRKTKAVQEVVEADFDDDEQSPDLGTVSIATTESTKKDSQKDFKKDNQTESKKDNQPDAKKDNQKATDPAKQNDSKNNKKK